MLAAERGGTDTVVLSGGVFQNRRLLGRTATQLADAGLRVLTPELLPPNDGGIAYGQLAVAAARLAAEEESPGCRSSPWPSRSLSGSASGTPPTRTISPPSPR